MVFLAKVDKISKSESEQAPRRILYAVGPGDVVGQYRDKQAGKIPPFQMSIPFSEQFLEKCEEAGAEAHLISWHGRRDRFQFGKFELENWPQPALYFKGGIKHYLGTMLYGLEIVWQAVRERATVVIADSGTTRWFVFSLLALFRIPVIAVMYSAIWPMGYPPTRRIDRLMKSLDGSFFRHFAAATVNISPECERQVRESAGKPRGAFYQFRPQYRREFLGTILLPTQWPFRPFNVLFIGRVEEFKGVFLILSMAERLEAEMPGCFKWRIVGTGAALERLRSEIVARSLSEIVEAPGPFPDEATARATMTWTHAMIVPTTSAFKEGLAMTAAESVLAGRPVVLSTVVPAWEVLANACIKVETDSVEAPLEALRRLATDHVYYTEHQQATIGVRDQFYDHTQSLGAVLWRAVAALH
jgi:glycosyltransferase involved in cell wall biosynthesis